MQNLIEPELAKMQEIWLENPHLQEEFPGGFLDPCPRFCTILESFSAWYFLARQRKHTESSIIQVARDGERLQLLLKEMFPHRSGKMDLYGFIVFKLTEI
jgi:hypothetical protein